MRLCHNCACAQHLWPGLGRAAGGETSLLCHLTFTLFPLGGMHGTGGDEVVPTLAELGTEILVWGTETQHTTCPTPSCGSHCLHRKTPPNVERICRASLSMGNHVNLLTTFINTCKGISCSHQGCCLVILPEFRDSRCFLLTQLWSQQILLQSFKT